MFDKEFIDESLGSKQCKLLIIKTPSSESQGINFLTKYLKSSTTKRIIGFDLEFNTPPCSKVQRQIAIFQISFYLSKYILILFFNPKLVTKQTNQLIHQVLTSKQIMKIGHGTDSLDIPAIYEYLGTDEKILEFTTTDNVAEFTAAAAVLGYISKVNKWQMDKDEFYDFDMDIYAPCALGATINDDTLSRLKCSIIAGAANNQLKVESVHGLEIMKKGIIYAPDYAINAGGVINCFSEVKGLPAEWAQQKAAEIYTTILNIVKRSQEELIPTYQIANKIAEERIKAKRIVELPL